MIDWNYIFDTFTAYFIVGVLCILATAISLVRAMNRVKDENVKKEIGYLNFFIYKLLNRNNEVIYVGKTNNIFARMNQHAQKKYIKQKEVTEIYFAQCASATDRDIYEIYYINKYSPKYNDKQRYCVSFSHILPELDFIKYDDNVIIEPIEKTKCDNALSSDCYLTIIQSFSLTELKILLLLIDNISDFDNLKYQIYFSDFSKIYNKKQMNYDHFYKCINKLLSKRIYINNNHINIIENIEHETGSEKITIFINNYIYDILTLFKSKLSTKIIKGLFGFTSKHSLKILLLLLYKSSTIVSVKIAELRSILGLKENEYKSFPDFRTKILDVVQCEFKNNLNIVLSFNLDKRGRKYDAIEFTTNQNDLI